MPTSNTTAKNVALDVAFFVSICFILLQNVADCCVLLHFIATDFGQKHGESSVECPLGYGN